MNADPQRMRQLLLRGVEALKTFQTVVVAGASADPEKYGYELVEVLRHRGLEVIPVNPKRTEIAGLRCFPNLEAVPEPPDIVVLALAPLVTERVVGSLTLPGTKLLWLPPGCFTDESARRAREVGPEVLAGICPVMAARYIEQEGAMSGRMDETSQ